MERPVVLLNAIFQMAIGVKITLREAKLGCVRLVERIQFGIKSWRDIPAGTQLFVTDSPRTWSGSFLLCQPDNGHLGHLHPIFNYARRILAEALIYSIIYLIIFIVILREELYIVLKAAIEHAELRIPFKRHQSVVEKNYDKKETHTLQYLLCVLRWTTKPTLKSSSSSSSSSTTSSSGEPRRHSGSSKVLGAGVGANSDRN